MADKIELGLFSNINDYDYHRSPGISKHGLDLINRSPAHYKEFTLDDSPALTFGAAFHCLVLEPDEFDKRFAVNPFDDMRTAKAKVWKTDQTEKNMRIISTDDYEHMIKMQKALLQHSAVNEILNLKQGKAEHSAYWIDNNFELWRNPDGPTFKLCRCRPDFINTSMNLVVDLKTAICSGYNAFARDVVRYRYHVQAAFYLDGLQACNVKANNFLFIVIEKKPPYAIGVYQLYDCDIFLGRQLYQRDLVTYSHCKDMEQWPGYSEHIRMLELPGWANTTDIY